MLTVNEKSKLNNNNNHDNNNDFVYLMLDTMPKLYSFC